MPQAPNHWGRRKVFTMTPKLSSIQHIAIRFEHGGAKLGHRLTSVCSWPLFSLVILPSLLLRVCISVRYLSRKKRQLSGSYTSGQHILSSMSSLLGYSSCIGSKMFSTAERKTMDFMKLTNFIKDFAIYG